MKWTNRRKIFLVSFFALLSAVVGAGHVPDASHLEDRAALDEIQRDAFWYVRDNGDPATGMVYEASVDWGFRPIAVGGTGFAAAAIVVAVDRGWFPRNRAVDRLLRITGFLLEKTERKLLHGAFPHWLDGATGKAIGFSEKDDGADLVETSLLLQGLLIARAYFDGPGAEERLREEITAIWEDVDWNRFTDGGENGLYWHWSPRHGFASSLRILGYNECLITYLLAMASPTRPITRRAYDYWTSGKDYQSRVVSGYDVEATMEGGGPLFLAHYSFIGPNPALMADAFVPGGYYVRNVRQTLANRAYCLQEAPAENRYAPDFWGLTASQVPGGYAVNESRNDTGTLAPTAALSSMPYVPLYSLQVLRNLRGGLREKIWGPNGPYDAVNLREAWASDSYLAIDQLPIVCMIENYRSGLLWNLFMSDPDVRRGLARAGLVRPDLPAGFPESVVTLKILGGRYAADAHDAVRHPDAGKYIIPYWCEEDGEAIFSLTTSGGAEVFSLTQASQKGRNLLMFEQPLPPSEDVLALVMRHGGMEYVLPIRIY